MTLGCSVRTDTATRHSGRPAAMRRGTSCSSTSCGCCAERAPSISQALASAICASLTGLPSLQRHTRQALLGRGERVEDERCSGRACVARRVTATMRPAPPNDTERTSSLPSPPGPPWPARVQGGWKYLQERLQGASDRVLGVPGRASVSGSSCRRCTPGTGALRALLDLGLKGTPVLTAPAPRPILRRRHFQLSMEQPAPG